MRRWRWLLLTTLFQAASGVCFDKHMKNTARSRNAFFSHSSGRKMRIYIYSHIFETFFTRNSCLPKTGEHTFQLSLFAFFSMHYYIFLSHHQKVEGNVDPKMKLEQSQNFRGMMEDSGDGAQFSNLAFPCNE